MRRWPRQGGKAGMWQIVTCVVAHKWIKTDGFLRLKSPGRLSVMGPVQVDMMMVRGVQRGGRGVMIG